MAIPLLNADQRKQLANELPDWPLLPKRDAIQKTFLFKNFVAAFACMSEIANAAEAQQHHPEWFNVWNRLEITLSTHDSGGLTQKDIDLALQINAIYIKLTAA